VLGLYFCCGVVVGAAGYPCQGPSALLRLVSAALWGRLEEIRTDAHSHHSLPPFPHIVGNAVNHAKWSIANAQEVWAGEGLAEAICIERIPPSLCGDADGVTLSAPYMSPLEPDAQVLQMPSSTGPAMEPIVGSGCGFRATVAVLTIFHHPALLLSLIDALATTVTGLHADFSGIQTTVRTLALIKPTRDLRTRLMAASSGMSDAEAKELNLFHDLLEKCLHLNPDKRITPHEALKHPFLASRTHGSSK